MSSARVTAHFEHYLGSGEVRERVGEIELWMYARPEFVTVATNGLAAAGRDPRQELACSVREGSEWAAAIVVRSTVQMLVGGGHGLVAGQIIPGGGSLADTRISGVIAASHPYLGAGLGEISPSAEDTDPIGVITLVPITAEEMDLVHGSGPEALYERFEEINPPLLDIGRATAVEAGRRG